MSVSEAELSIVLQWGGIIIVCSAVWERKWSHRYLMSNGVESGVTARDLVRKILWNNILWSSAAARIHKTILWFSDIPIPQKCRKQRKKSIYAKICSTSAHTWLLTSCRGCITCLVMSYVALMNELLIYHTACLAFLWKNKPKFPLSLCYFSLLSLLPTPFPSSFYPAADDECVWTMPVSDFKPAQHLPAFSVNFHGL